MFLGLADFMSGRNPLVAEWQKVKFGIPFTIGENMKKILLMSICIMITISLCSCDLQKTRSFSTTSSTSPTRSTTPGSEKITASPVPTGSLTPLPSFIPSTPASDEQVYLDPEGWYSVNIPADWQNRGNPNIFSGENGFFETGYLPEMMFIDYYLVICQWMANISTKNTYSVSWLGNFRESCQLVTLPEVTPAAVVEVIINPSADFAQRIFYLKADADHFSKMVSTFTWLQPIAEDGELSYQTAPLRAEDISFWENTAPMPPEVTVTEYKLPEEAQDKSPTEEIFTEYVPAEALPDRKGTGGTYIQKTLENINEVIMPFGYELRAGPESYPYDLYQDGILALKNISRLPDIYTNVSSGSEKLSFIVHTVNNLDKPFYEKGNAASYLIQSDSINLWEDKPPNPMLTEGRSIWVEDELLILGLGDHTALQVRNANHDLLFSFFTYFGTHIPINKYLVWDDHWILGVSDFIIMDGQILNEILGFEEVYNWYLIDDKPFYFFRKGPRTGISYDGQFLPVHYHEIIHGYCCGLALNNPINHENSVRFFGNRDGTWYYVVVEIN